MIKAQNNLFNLDELPDYKVAKNYNDVRTWKVKDANNHLIGKVDHLVVSKSAERVVYLDIEVEQSFINEGYSIFHQQLSLGVHEVLNKEGENHLIIPIGMAIIDPKNKEVITNQIDSSNFAKAKRFKNGDLLDFNYELSSIRHYKEDKAYHDSNKLEGFYERKEFNNSLHLRETE